MYFYCKKKLCRDAMHLKQALRRAENYLTKNIFIIVKNYNEVVKINYKKSLFIIKSDNYMFVMFLDSTSDHYFIPTVP